MAGKHVGNDQYANRYAHKPSYPDRVNKAWAEGFTGNPGFNPHPAGTPAHVAYSQGATAALPEEAAAPGTSPVRLTFDATSTVIALGINFDMSLPLLVEYNCVCTDWGANRAVWATNDPAVTQPRWRGTQQDIFFNLAGETNSFFNAGNPLWLNNHCKIRESWDPVTQEMTVTVISAPYGTQVETEAYTPTVPNLNNIRLGFISGQQGWAGTIWDFRVTENGVLKHWYPIDEGSGTVIRDVVGGQDGTLTLGNGSWS